MHLLFAILSAVLLTACGDNSGSQANVEYNYKNKVDSLLTQTLPENKNFEIVVGAARKERYFHLLNNKRVGLLINHSSYVENQHLIDFLISNNIQVKKIFVPEHGYRGVSDAGAHIEDGTDPSTGIPIISLYGNKKKPALQDLDSVDIVIYDIQDVGVRFYTYISTMHYMMERCAEDSIPMIVLDRPNPNGYYVDGPVLETKFQSFVGMHEIPVVYGLTAGELAMMINEEGWLSDGMSCNLTIVPCDNYKHSKRYSLPIKPSPNLPSDRSVQLYPSLCFFEATRVSVGRGTNLPFEMIGIPYELSQYDTTFIPKSLSGASSPKHMNKKCYGFILSKPNDYFDEDTSKMNLSFLIKMKELFPGNDFIDRPDFFDKLAGTNQLRLQLLSGLSESEIRRSWQKGLESYLNIRKKYLIYD